MHRTTLNPDSLHKPIGRYSQVAACGGMIATAGMASIDVDGNVVGAGDIRRQTKQTIDNMLNALAAMGAGKDDVIRVTVYLTDFSDYKAMNEVYAEVFDGDAPARATVKAELVDPKMLIEMEAIAVVSCLKDGAPV